jgi:hypothetical protein
MPIKQLKYLGNCYTCKLKHIETEDLSDEVLDNINDDPEKDLILV